MEGFFGKLPPPEDPDPDDFGCGGGENENSMLNWEWQASARYGGQSVNLRNWLQGISRDPRQPRITTWTGGGAVCRACDNFDVKAAVHQVQTAYSERYALWNKQVRIKDIKEAAEKGCKRCEVLVQALYYLDLQESDEEVKLKFLSTSVAMFTDNPPRHLEVFPSEDKATRVCGFPPGMKNGRRRFGDVADSACFEDITMAINDCILNHRECRPSTNPARPNRLIVVPEEDGQPIKVVKAPQGVEYAALSHCWGKEPLKRLLKQDGDGEVTIQWDELPASFRDACTVTRRLFLQYVWIDSLCIVQDDSDDWEREAAKMGSIYESAYVTISATDAAASVEGFLFPRFTASFFTAVDNTTDRFVRFTARRYNLDKYNKKFPHYGDTPDHPWLLRANDMDKQYLNPLQLRGWCFQERLMAKRILHFKRYEVVLECNAGFRCECSGMKTMSRKSVKSLVSLMMQDSLSRSEMTQAEKLRDLIFSETGRMSQSTKERVATSADVRLMQIWEMLVEIYTRTSFTHQDDVLPALGSLAQIFQAVRPHWTYVGGLWLEQFRRSLMWVPRSPRGGDGTVAVRTKPSKPDGRPPMRVAPSFTWAALSGRMRYMAAEYAGKTEFEVISASTTPTGTDPYGDIASGHIVLRGRAVAFRFWLSEAERGVNEMAIQISNNDWDSPYCTQSKQYVEVCTDIDAATLEWKSTSKVESGMETLEMVKGFDSSEEYAKYFDDGVCSETEMTEEEIQLRPPFPSVCLSMATHH